MGATNVGLVWQTCKKVKLQWDNDPAATRVELDRQDDDGKHSQVIHDRGAPYSSCIDPNLNCSIPSYDYTVRNWAGKKELDPGRLTISTWCCGSHSSGGFIQENTGELDLLVPLGGVINEFLDGTSVINGQIWPHLHTLHPLKDNLIAASLIQSASGKLEAIAREGLYGPITIEALYDVLVAYESEPGAEWQGPVKLAANDGPIDRVIGTPALIQTNYDNQGKFELLAPRGNVIDHYTHPNGTILEGQWTHAHQLMPPQYDPLIQFTSVSFVQSTSGLLEAIARATPPQPAGAGDAGKGFLLAYEFDPVPESDLAPKWQGPTKLTADDGPIDGVTGSPAFIQSTLNDQEKFELLVPQGTVLKHYTLENETILDSQWKHAHTLILPADDPQAQFSDVWLIQSAAGKLEAVARLKPSVAAKGDYLVGYEFDPVDGWKGPAKLVADDGPIHIGVFNPL
jgi:hypothetical protein